MQLQPVDTGNLGSALDVREFQTIRTDVVERRLSEFLGYTNEPELFIERLLSTHPFPAVVLCLQLPEVSVRKKG